MRNTIRLGLILLLASCASAPGGGSGTAPTVATTATTADGTLPALAPAAPVSAQEYASRRRALLDSLGDGVLVVFGAPSPAADYLPFTQLGRRTTAGFPLPRSKDNG